MFASNPPCDGAPLVLLLRPLWKGQRRLRAAVREVVPVRDGHGGRAVGARRQVRPVGVLGDAGRRPVALPPEVYTNYESVN